jgi:lipopolysaccharide transport system permease protein
MFATSLSQSSNSLVASGHLLSKVYFPRLSLPIAAVLASVVDFVFAFLVLICLMVYYGQYPRPVAVAVVPALVLLALVTALGAGLWLSALNVAYRDVQYVVPFFTQLWFFVTPVVYPLSLLSEPWQTIAGINPMAGVVEGFRWALLGEGPSPGPMIGVSAAAAIVLLAAGALYFRRMERTFADVV